MPVSSATGAATASPSGLAENESSASYESALASAVGGKCRCMVVCQTVFNVPMPSIPTPYATARPHGATGTANATSGSANRAPHTDVATRGLPNRSRGAASAPATSPAIPAW